MNYNTEDVITESLEDATLPQEAVETEVDTQAQETPVEAATEPIEAVEEVSSEVASPASRVPATQPDEFDKKYGLAAQSASGRENRIPYSRVKKIIEKREKELKAQLEGEYTPKVTDYETKVKDYEAKLQKVAEFEQVLVNEPEKFFQLLATIPAYAPYFAQQAQPQAEAAAPATVADEAMPEPTERLADGTLTYDINGVKALLDWKGNQVAKQLRKEYDDKLNQFSQKFSPIEQEYQAQQYMAKLVPQVQAQITEARTWPQFNENEEDIVKALQADQRLSLEGAYRRVVFPKLTSKLEELAPDRTKIRQEVLAEIKRAPTATSAPGRVSRPNTQSSTSGPRDLESVIAEQVKNLKG